MTILSLILNYLQIQKVQSLLSKMMKCNKIIIYDNPIMIIDYIILLCIVLFLGE